jgi:4-hydroxy-tetrahydrodipicolinate synthase
LAELPTIAAVKESSGNLEQIAELISLLPPQFPVYSGDDALTLPILSIGGCGVISVASHIVGPAIHQMIEKYYDGQIMEAAKIHRDLLPVFKVLFITTNPTAVKAAMNLSGFPVGDVRLPLVYPGEADLGRLRDVLTKAGIELA